MKKQVYIQPEMQIVPVRATRGICQNSPTINNVESGGVFANEIEGGSGPSRGRSHSYDVWGEEEEEDM